MYNLLQKHFLIIFPFIPTYNNANAIHFRNVFFKQHFAVVGVGRVVLYYLEPLNEKISNFEQSTRIGNDFQSFPFNALDCRCRCMETILYNPVIYCTLNIFEKKQHVYSGINFHLLWIILWYYFFEWFSPFLCTLNIIIIQHF